jgi:hypothetical protein
MSWPVSAGACVLETSPTPGADGWTAVTNSVQTNASSCVVTVPLHAESVFFRLQRAN